MNKYALNNLFIFSFGAAIGSVITWKLVKTKYEKEMREFYDSVTAQVCSEEESEEEDEEDIFVDEELDEETKEKNKYKTIVNNEGYIYNDDEDDDEDGGDDEMIEPYVIIPEEFDENGYSTVTLFCYEDGVLAYQDNNEVVDNVEELIGDIVVQDHFGEYEDDSVFIRNDMIKTDFEILRDSGRYSEVD